ncbi:hypothetical protein [Clostridium botulinum]|uniref:hypothetical protein n=1 Tax=Clostridium botulinum TaxID=1491 RepID=UPI0013F0A5B7|nr:hypothetical protein [Clostridium botulinum]EGT5649380.1 DUF722 domain-containing protein [Clostridium botulinum]MBY6755501.1 DUF722 domain-containing protein [Clostridium botulinum]MBY6766428.1 DUF722 domain-containing protein [Clostridium botulinum]MBY6900368.1 DUF722 domain-containing protein [Clostridium botulinum]MBY6914633.1 DUF722 domain-containing protein [Clostridium botulinum]
MKKDKTLYSKLEGILYNYKRIKQEINNIYLEIHYIESNYKESGAISYEEKSSPTNKFNSVVENEVIQKEKIIEKLKKTLESKELIINKIDNALSTLTEKEREIIIIRYIEGQGEVNWPTVANKTYLSESRCYQIKDDTIKNLIPIVFLTEL